MQVKLEKTARELKIHKLQSQNYKKLPLWTKSIDRLFKKKEKIKKRIDIKIEWLDDKLTAILKLLQEKKKNKEKMQLSW